MPTPRQGKRLSAVQGFTRRVRPESCGRPRDAPSVGAVRRADFSVAGRPAHRWSRRRQVLSSGSRWPDPRCRSDSGNRNVRAGSLLPEPCLRAARSSRLPVFRLILVDSDVAFIGKPIGVIGRRQGISPVPFLPRRARRTGTRCAPPLWVCSASPRLAASWQARLHVRGATRAEPGKARSTPSRETSPTRKGCGTQRCDRPSNPHVVPAWQGHRSCRADVERALVRLVKTGQVGRHCP